MKMKNRSSLFNMLVLLAVVLIIFSFVFSSFFLVDHHCTGEHCIICILSSSADVRTLLFLSVIAFVMLVLSACLDVQKFTVRRETLVSLKRKLTI